MANKEASITRKVVNERSLLDLKKAVKGVASILLLGPTACTFLPKTTASTPESTPLPDQQLPVSFYKFIYNPDKPNQGPNQEVSEATKSFTDAAQKGELIYAKLGTDGITNSVGNIKNVVAGNFGIPEASVAQQIEDQSTAPNPSSIIEIKFGDKFIFIKIVKIPTTDGEKSIMFGNFGDKWRQIIYVQGENGFDISSDNDGVMIGGPGKVNLILASDSTNPPEFNSLLTVGDPNNTNFAQALYPLSNEGSSPLLVLRDKDGRISGSLPEGLFNIVKDGQPEPTKPSNLGKVINISFKQGSLDVTPTPPDAQPTEGVVPAEATPTTEVSPTPEVPMIEVTDAQGNKVSVPDILNPEFVKENPEAVKSMEDQIVIFAKTMGITPEEVAKGLHVELEIPNNGAAPFAVLRTTDGVALMMMNEQGQWIKAMPGEYWYAQGKFLGGYFEGNIIGSETSLINTLFKNGVVGLNGTVRPGPDIDERKPKNAIESLRIAHSSISSVYFHYIAEPGKYPNYVTAKNANEWMMTRLQETANLYGSPPDQPIFIEFNEALSYKTAGWNPERDPFRDTHGKKWMEEYIYMTLKTFIDRGYVPNKNFFIVFNDDNPFNIPRIEIFHQKITEARVNAFNRLMADQKMSEFLYSNNINLPEDLSILLGAQTDINEATDDKLAELANIFSDTGGVILTEVNLKTNDSTIQQKEIQRLTKNVINNPKLRGLLFFNLARDDNPDYPRISLLSPDNKPTASFFSLLQEENSSE